MWLQLRSLFADLQWISPKLPSHWLSATTVGMTSSNFSSEKDLTTDETNSGDAPELNSEAPETCTGLWGRKRGLLREELFAEEEKTPQEWRNEKLDFLPSGVLALLPGPCPQADTWWWGSKLPDRPLFIFAFVPGSYPLFPKCFLVS